MTRPLTVVQLLPALESGGVERSTLEINRALVEAGHRSLVISAGGRLVEQLVADGGRHVTLDIGRKSLATPFRIPALRRALQEIRPDIVHVRSRLPAWLAKTALSGWPGQAPKVVTTVHGLNSVGRYSAIMLEAHRVICVSGCVRQYLQQHYPQAARRDLRVIPRGFDPLLFSPRKADPAWRAKLDVEFPELAGRQLLLMPGRGTRLKGHDIALRLCAKLAEGDDNVGLLLAGVDQATRQPYLDELKALSRQLGIEDRVAFSVSRDDLPDAYAASDLVLQLSTKPEAFGRTALEALAMQRPVVGFAHGGVGDLLAALYPAGTVPVGDEQALLVKARKLLQAPTPVAAFEGYRVADMQQATLALYAELVDG